MTKKLGSAGVPAAFALGLLASGCGKGVGMGEVTFRSGGFTDHTHSAGVVSTGSGVAHALPFDICVRRIRLEDEGDKPRLADDRDDAADGETGYIEFNPGLLALETGEARDWGKVRVPTGFKLKRIKVKVQKHEQLCGVSYSVKYASDTTNRDIEFRWRFDPPVELKDGKVVKLAMDRVAAAIREAAEAGQFSKVKEYVEAIEDQATLED